MLLNIFKWLFVFVLSIFATTISAAPEEKLLNPEQAYRLEVRTLNKSTLEARWRIEDGYYLYRSKLKFSAKPDSLIIGTPVFPHGKIKDDEFFGKVETYRKEAAIRIPLPEGTPEKFTLAVTSQGCSDLGVCFPPRTQYIDVDLGSAPPVQPVKASPAAATLTETSTNAGTG
ncbi:MAG: protein-disulfide reductase DsbD family protein, partial [Gallionellaceae bacterium]|nr:protein-disulfide reductase DsbD family protein [Gallionellaceae bacterium]